MPVRLLLALLFVLPAAAQPARLAPGDVSPELSALLHRAHDALCERHVTVENGRPILWHTLIAKDSTANTVVPDTRALLGIPPSLGKGAQSAVFEVRYSGNFPSRARQAFSFAADVWGTHVASDAPVVIDASWEQLGENVLGSAGTTFIFANDAFLPLRDIWYPAALAEALAGTNLTEDDADVRARFNSDFGNWYFGVDDNTPASDFNFATVVLHEIGHGLGFFDSFDFDGGRGSFGFLSGSTLFPFVFDVFLEDENDVPLLTLANPSRALGDVLQSDNVFFDGSALRGVSGDIPVQLFAPGIFEPGSSIAHLDEDAFPAGEPNSLMTPLLARDEAIYSPGPFTCAIFADMGWPLGDDCRVLVNQFIVSFDAESQGRDVTLSFELGTRAIDRVVVERRYFDDPFVQVEIREVEPGERAITIADRDLVSGRYTYRLRLLGPGGTTDGFVSDEREIRIRPTDEFEITQSLRPNPFASQASLDLIVRFQQDVTTSLYDVQGRLVRQPFTQNLRGSERAQIRIDGGGLAAGLYFLRVTGENFQFVRPIVRVGG